VDRLRGGKRRERQRWRKVERSRTKILSNRRLSQKLKRAAKEEAGNGTLPPPAAAAGKKRDRKEQTCWAVPALFSAPWWPRKRSRKSPRWSTTTTRRPRHTGTEQRSPLLQSKPRRNPALR
jgi:hypothetical protein